MWFTKVVFCRKINLYQEYRFWDFWSRKQLNCFSAKINRKNYLNIFVLKVDELAHNICLTHPFVFLKIITLFWVNKAVGCKKCKPSFLENGVDVFVKYFPSLVMISCVNWGLPIWCFRIHLQTNCSKQLFKGNIIITRNKCWAYAQNDHAMKRFCSWKYFNKENRTWVSPSLENSLR